MNYTDLESGLTYEAPAIEVVLAPEDVEREVLYAGGITPK